MKLLGMAEAIVWAAVGVVGLGAVVIASAMAGELVRDRDDPGTDDPREYSELDTTVTSRCGGCNASSPTSFANFANPSPPSLESADLSELETRSIDVQFALAVLAGLEAEPTVWAISFLDEWARNEGAYAARYNPLATTRREPGSTCYNAVCVRHYPDFETGVAATVATLNQASFASIVDSLRAAAVTDRRTVDAALRRWGTVLLADKVAAGWAPVSD